MPDALAAAFALPGLWALIGAILVSGTVYGFAGFGAALVFLPVAVALVPPELAVAAFSLTAVSSLVTVVPRAWPMTGKRTLGLMLAGATAGFPLGVWVLRAADETAIRWAVSGLVLATLAALVAGWRMRAAPGTGALLGVGGATGVIGGATGLTGPVVILFNLGAGAPAAVTRANTLVFLTLASALLLPQLWAQGLLRPEALWLGLILMGPYAVGNWIGQAMFDPAREALYRRVAYAIIGASALAGLPVWD
ncbi:sulfite exporter TauE/SafE family protein [Roseicyclus persicicus]|uniref:Probable membrane transporter protein n=1 Tax=Roseicyclus persicicus TaxID=2650661 RepID=A0A7X6JY66_9RHOB|nr:sulfite exporter TauE/SafE family protein [Roseibacterium persicicum]NKX43498.1 sulfite exporter TauE/SafE family protein [Roseibacterium persicicum]